MIPVRVISLAAAAERRATMAGHLAGLAIPFTFFDAVYGRDMTAAELAAIDPRPVDAEFGRRLLPGEIGCAASYQRLCAEIAAGPDPFVLVVEDDARLVPTATAFLDPDFLSSLPPFDVLRCHFSPWGGGPARLVGERAGHRVYAPLRLEYHTTAQIFSRRGAAKLSRLIGPLRAPLDHVIYRDPRSGLCCLDVRPPLAEFAGYVSQIGPGRVTRDNRRRLVPVVRRALTLAVRKFLTVPAYIRFWGVGGYLALRREAAAARREGAE